MDVENFVIEQQKDAINFLNKYNHLGPRLFQDVQFYDLSRNSAEDVVYFVQNIIKEKWSELLHLQNVDLQQNAEFQRLLTIAVENFITELLYDQIIYVLRQEFKTDDLHIFKMCKRLCNLNISPDQLGVPEIFQVPFPAAVVELASLDLLRNPIEKLNCLQTTYDLILAELKSAIVDIISEMTDLEIPTISNEVLVNLLMLVIIKSKPVHLISNIFFVNNFQRSLTPSSEASCVVNIFELSVLKLKNLSIQDLRPSKNKLPSEWGLQDLIQITDLVSGRFDRHGKRIEKISSPVDIQLERLTEMIASATLENR